MLKKLLLVTALLVTLASSAKVEIYINSDHVLHGVVSWYGGSHHGRTMKNGEKFNKHMMTCAATSKYKIGDVLEVTNADNGKSVVVTVTDRGNFKKYGRVLDLSEGAFKRIASLNKGLVNVKIKKLN